MIFSNPILGPFTVAGIAWLISFRLWRRKRIDETGVWGGGIAIACGVILTYLSLLSFPPFIPEDPMDWVPHVAVLAMIPSVFQRFWGGKVYTFIPVVAVTATFSIWMQSINKIRYRWETSEAFMWIIGLGIAIGGMAWYLEILARRRNGASMPASMFVYSLMSCVLLVFSGSELLAQLMGALSAVFAVAVILSWWNPLFTLTQGAMTVFAIVFYGLIMQGYWYGEMPLTSALIVVFSPWCIWYGETRKVFYMKPHKAVLWRMGLVAVPMGFALLIAAYGYFRGVQ